MLAGSLQQLKYLAYALGAYFLWFSRAAANSASLNNPLGDVSFQAFLMELVGIVQIIIIPFVVVFVIYAGFTYVVARGNPENIARANRALVYALIGTVIILGAEAISDIVENTVTSF